MTGKKKDYEGQSVGVGFMAGEHEEKHIAHHLVGLQDRAGGGIGADTSLDNQVAQ